MIGGIAHAEARPLQPLTLKADLRSIRCLAFAPDGKLLAAAGDVKPSGLRVGLVRLRELPTRRERASLRDPGPPGAGSNSVASVAFAPDGTILATATTSGVKLWAVATGWDIATLSGYGTRASDQRPAGFVLFPPDGKTLATHLRSIELWDVAGRTLRLNLDPEGEALASAPVRGRPT